MEVGNDDLYETSTNSQALGVYFTILGFICVVLVARQQLWRKPPSVQHGTTSSPHDRREQWTWQKWSLLVLSFVVFGGIPNLALFVRQRLIQRRRGRQVSPQSRSPAKSNSSLFEKPAERERNELFLDANSLLKAISESSWVIPAEKLQIFQEVGTGAFGVVRMGTYNSTMVAVKSLPPSEVGELDAATVRRLKALQREVSILTSLRHPNVVLFMGVCLSPLCMVTEYCQKGSLFDLLQDAATNATTRKSLTWKTRIKMALDGALGMAHLHSKDIMHRDLKSPNLLVDISWHVKVGDLGLVALASSSTTQSLYADNPRWLAPEVAQGMPFSLAADVYSFGTILWEIMTMTEPFAGMSCPQILFALVVLHKRPEIPDLDSIPGGTFSGLSEYLQLMDSCWELDPLKRPSFQSIANTLRQILCIMSRR